MITKCHFCGKEKDMQVSKLRERNFCNIRCFGDSISKKVECICEECGKAYKRKPSEGKGRFCSMKCVGIWKRGAAQGYISTEGYKYVHPGKEHVLANSNGDVLEHWFVMYELDRTFTSFAKRNHWTIHHRNGIRTDNRIENLEWKASGPHGPGADVGWLTPRGLLSKWYTLLAERS